MKVRISVRSSLFAGFPRRGAARALASAGPSVTICGRGPQKITAALATLREQLPDATFGALEVDLASLARIATATKSFLDRGQAIDLLINDAGATMADCSRSRCIRV